MRVQIFIAALILCVFAGPNLAWGQQDGPPPTAPAVERARQKVLERGSYQTDLPRNSTSESGADPRALGRDFSWLAELAPFASFLVRLLLAFAIIGLVVYVVREYTGRTTMARMKGKPSLAAKSIHGEDFHIDMDEIRQFAAHGRYSEAIHSLLLRTFEELCRLGNIEIRESKTSREIAREIPLSAELRRDLESLVETTELCHFGGKDASRADFDNCVAHHGRFIHALGGVVA